MLTLPFQNCIKSKNRKSRKNNKNYGHQNKMPYSMFALSRELKKYPDVKVVEYFHDYSFCGMVKSLMVMMRFMPLYARAKYVFISDCYVPVSCCKKRKETVVV